MPAARNQADAVRRFSRNNNRPKKTDQKRSWVRRSRKAANWSRAADTTAGIVHNDMAGPPADGVWQHHLAGRTGALPPRGQAAANSTNSRKVQLTIETLENKG